jgi:hypothetical protein
MKPFLIYVFFLLLITGCTNANNPDKKSEVAKKVQVDLKTIYDTISLTAEEMKDDSLDDGGYITGTTWEHAGIADSVSFKKFVKQLKIWVAAGEKEMIAEALDYPLSNPEISGKEGFISAYDKYFNEKVKNALLSQKLSQIYHDRLGIRIRDGELWIKQTKDGFKITAINY